VLAHGVDGLPPFSPASVVTEAQPASLAAVLLIVAAGVYLWGVLKLRGRGDRWPVGRTVVFLLGLAALALAMVSGIATYDATLLSIHMVQHMILSMAAPILLALGAPVTLALRTASPGPRRVLLTALHSSVAKFFTFPLVTFGLFVASPFVLYFSGLYRVTLEHEWFHQFVHLHFVIVGCLFFWPLIGIDPLPGRMSYPLRALLMFLSTPFHTVLGLTVMQSANLLGGDWYSSLELGWADPFADQQLAGGILWAGGEFVAVGMLGALVFQWMRHADREARRIDRALDRAEAEQAALERAEAQQAALDRVEVEAAMDPVEAQPPLERGEVRPALDRVEQPPAVATARETPSAAERALPTSDGVGEAVGSAGSYEAETHR
jgi:putative copper resistance protein D